MTKRNRIILIISLIILALAAAMTYSYLMAKKAAPDVPVTFKDFFTFGTASNTAPSSEGSSTSPTSIINGENTGVKSTLRKISNRPVAGALALLVERTAVATPGVSTVGIEWSRNLKEGDTGEDVKELQVFLNQNIEPAGTATHTSTQIAATGAGSPGHESTTFGPATKKAVITFQEKFASDILAPQNLTAGTGIVDEKTREKIHSLKASLPSKEKALAIRYADQETGNIYQTFVDNIEEKKISNTTIPKIHEAFFGGNSVMMRFLEENNATIATFSGTLPVITEGGDAPIRTQGTFLERNIKTVALSPDKEKFFYLTNTEQSAIGTIASLSGEGKNQVFTSAFTEWLPQWVNERIVALTTKPSAQVPGYTYALDIKTKEFNKILGNVNGLTTLWSPNGKKILYSRSTGAGIILSLYDIDAKQSSELGINTLPDKCVWAPDSIVLYCGVPDLIPAGSYPDLWYQGVIAFSDSIWKLDTVTSLFKTLARPQNDAGVSIDAINLLLDPTQSYLYFINKSDGILWELAL